MVHWVPDEGVDDGPVIAQRTVPFEADDTLAAYESRLHAAEHLLYIDALSLVLSEPTIECPTTSRTGSS